MVVTERPSTVAAAVVMAIAGGWLARTVQVRVCAAVAPVAVLGCDRDFHVLRCSCDGRRGQREAPHSGRVGDGADCAQRCCRGDGNSAVSSSSASRTVPLMVVTERPSTVAGAVVKAIAGGWLARTVQARTAVAVRPPLSSAVTVTSISWAAAATAGAVSVKLHTPAVLVTALTVPSVVAAVTVTALSSSSASLTVPLMVVTERPSTVAAAVVMAIAGGWLGSSRVESEDEGCA